MCSEGYSWCFERTSRHFERASRHFEAQKGHFERESCFYELKLGLETNIKLLIDTGHDAEIKDAINSLLDVYKIINQNIRP